MTSTNSTELFSGRFDSVIPLLSRRELTQIQDTDEVKAFFQSLFIDRKPILIRAITETGGNFEGEMLLATDEALTINIDTQLNEKITITFRWLNKTYCFFLNALQLQPGQTLPLPQKVYAVHRRKWDRDSIQKELKASLLMPDGTAVCEGTIANFTDRGLGFLTSTESTTPLALFGSMQLTLATGDISSTSLNVEMVHISRQNGHTLVGCRIQDDSLPSYRTLYSSFMQALLPDVRKVATEEDRQAMARMLEHSVLGSGRPALENHPQATDISEGSYFLLPGPEGSGALLGAHRMYEKTWLVHTLGLTKDYAMSLPTQLFHRVGNYVVGEVGASYLCGLWPSKSRLLDRSYTAFVENDFNPQDHHFETLHVLQFRTDAVKDPLSEKEAITVELVKAKDWGVAKEILRTTCSTVYWDATNLDEFFSSADSKPTSNKRRRHLLVAKDHETVLGLAIMERGGLTPSTFGLSNHFRLFFAPGVDKERVGKILFREAMRIYHSAGISTCTMYVSEKDANLGSWTGLTARLERIYFWIARTTRAQAFLRHLEHLDWELRFLEQHRSELKPSLLKKLRFKTEPFRRRQCSRLEGKLLPPTVRCDLVMKDGRLSTVSMTSLDTFGCGLEIPPAIRMEKGETFRLKIRIPGDTPVEVTGEVQYVIDRPSPGFSSLVRMAGFRFLDPPAVAVRVIREFAFHHLNPDLALFQKEDYGPLTDLLEKSKYFSYYEGADHQRFIREGKETYASLDRMYPDLARVTVLKDHEQVIGSHSFYRLTPRTWQLHQLVVDETTSLYKSKIPTKTVLQGTFQYLSLDPSAEYFVTYFHDEAAIAKTYFEGRNHHDNPRDSAYLPFRGFAFENLSELNLETSGEFIIERATEEELDRIVGYLETLVSRLEFDALDFGDLRQSNFLGTFSQRGFKRERQVFVARNKKGEMLNFAIANICPLGTNLICILDTVRLFDLPWCGPIPEIARLDLAKHVASYYRELGRTQVYLEVDEVVGHHYTALPARDLTKNWRLIVSRAAYMATLQFLITRFEKLEKRLGKLRLIPKVNAESPGRVQRESLR